MAPKRHTASPKRVSHSPKRPLPAHGERPHNTSGHNIDQKSAIFKALDFERCGVFRYGHLAVSLKACNAELWNDAAVAKVFDAMDLNRDGLVNEKEFLMWASTVGSDILCALGSTIHTALSLSRYSSSRESKPMMLDLADELQAPTDLTKQMLTRMEAVRSMCLFSAAVATQDSELACEVVPGLWLGSKKNAHDLVWHRELDIRAILNLAADDMDDPEDGYPDDTKVLRIAAEDAEYPLLTKHLSDSFTFVHTCLSENPPRPVLVHCVQGLNRSATIVAACVMLLRQEDLISVFLNMSRMRSDIINNPDFQRQLVALAFANDLLDHAPRVDAELEDYARLQNTIFAIFASSDMRLTSASFRDGALMVLPSLSADVLDGLEESLAWFRDDGKEGIEGMMPSSICSWLASCSRAYSLLLHPLLQLVSKRDASASMTLRQISTCC